MLTRPTTVDPLTAGLAVQPARYEQAAYNQPMQDTTSRTDSTAPPDVIYVPQDLETEDGLVLQTEADETLTLEAA